MSNTPKDKSGQLNKQNTTKISNLAYMAIQYFDNADNFDANDPIGSVGVTNVKMSRLMAMNPNASNRAKKTWKIFDNWLGLNGAGIGPEEIKRIRVAAIAYYAVGIAPSHELQPCFDHLVGKLKAEEYNFFPKGRPLKLCKLLSECRHQRLKIKAKGVIRRELSPIPCKTIAIVCFVVWLAATAANQFYFEDIGHSLNYK